MSAIVELELLQNTTVGESIASYIYVGFLNALYVRTVVSLACHLGNQATVLLDLHSMLTDSL